MKPGDEPPLLTFQWRERDHPLLRLSLYVIISFACATGFFLLFKVVYPQARHFSTAPQQLLVLDPSQTATRDIVNRTTDANFLLLSPDADAANADGERDLFPVFQPSFAGFEMKLVDLPGEEDKRTLPRVFSIQDMPLPPIPTVMKAQPPASERKAGPSSLQIRLHGDLAKRDLIHTPEMKDLKLSEASPPRFRLSVNREGLVTFALPLESLADGKQMRALQKVVSGLRFKAVEADGVQWGEATFAWEAARR